MTLKNQKRTKFSINVLAISIILTFVGTQNSFAASQSAIDAAYKQMYKKLADQGNNLALTAVTYYDTQVKQAIGKILDRKVNCDNKSKARYKIVAFDTSQSEVNQLINGFYLGFCNAK
jgi:hypothetical protein